MIYDASVSTMPGLNTATGMYALSLTDAGLGGVQGHIT